MTRGRFPEVQVEVQMSEPGLGTSMISSEIQGLEAPSQWRGL
jgi:hypothetical protein